MTTNARDEKWTRWHPNNGVDPIPKGAEFEIKDERGKVTPGNLLVNIRWRLEDDGHDIIAYRYRLDDNTMTPDEEEIPATEWAGSVPEGVKLNQHGHKVDSSFFWKDKKYSAYFKDVRHIDTLDVYRVLGLFECDRHGHAIGHAAKKLLLSGRRTGQKSVEHDVREAIDALTRWLEMRKEDEEIENG